MSCAFVFPGQGSQYVGMGRDIYDNFETVRDLFGRADEILGFGLAKLMFEGDEEQLRQTQNTQPALFLASIATMQACEQVSGKKAYEIADYFAGHSLGEYSALCAAGVFDFETGLKLVRKRGEFMNEAGQACDGAMLAVIGASFEALEKLISECKNEGEIVIANDNSEGQVVLSGASVAVKKASEIAKSFGAKMAVLLPVSGAFHSPLVKSAAYKIAEFLETVQLNEPKKPIISNVLASPVEDKNQIKDLLIKQIYSPVRWRETLGFLEQNGVEKMYEIGSKSVLCGLCKRTSKTIQPISIETKSDIIQHFTSL